MLCDDIYETPLGRVGVACFFFWLFCVLLVGAWPRDKLATAAGHVTILFFCVYRDESLFPALPRSPVASTAFCLSLQLRWNAHQSTRPPPPPPLTAAVASFVFLVFPVFFSYPSARCLWPMVPTPRAPALGPSYPILSYPVIPASTSRRTTSE